MKPTELLMEMFIFPSPNLGERGNNDPSHAQFAKPTFSSKCKPTKATDDTPESNGQHWPESKQSKHWIFFML
jgi:hypothetical protein